MVINEMHKGENETRRSYVIALTYSRGTGKVFTLLHAQAVHSVTNNIT
jgi:hypothetical protein